MNQIEFIESEILDLRKKLTNHSLYSHLQEIGDIKIFMEKHVYAVWDFMSLLKALQSQLTCVSIPWKPSLNPKTARFVNELVLAEESDVNENGVATSHYEMYLEAMSEVGASSKKISNLIRSIDDLENVSDVISNADLKKGEKDFLIFTFDIIQTDEVHKIAAAFTFGREDLIPDMFIEIIRRANDGLENKYNKLTYYLNRHIELDGDEHGPLSLEMIAELCGNNAKKWNDVLEVSKEALIKRIQLWDEITHEIRIKKQACALA